MGRAVDPRRAVAIALWLACAPGCAIINAAGPACTEDEFDCCDDGDDNDDDGDADCDDTDCFGVPGCSGQCDEDAPVEDLGSVPVAPITVDTCDQMVNRSSLGSLTSGCDGAETLALYRFRNDANGMRIICLDYQAAGRASIAANPCGTIEGMCADTTDVCRPLQLGARDYFISVPSSTGAGCGPLDISITVATGTEICLNGADDNPSTGTDCEDPFCQGRPECTHPLAGADEACNGENDGEVATFPSGAIDELACACATDAGCNELATGGLPPYVCHTDLPPVGVCGPPCNLGNWCMAFGLECGPDDRCHTP